MKNISLLLLLFSLSITATKAQKFKYVADGPIEVDKYYDLDSAAVRVLQKGDTIILTGWLFPYWKVSIGTFNGYIHEIWIKKTPEMKRYTDHLDSARFIPKNIGPAMVKPLEDVYPEFIYGQNGWRKYLAENLKIPKELAAGEAVKVWVKFVVEKNGRVTHINVPERADDEYTKEAVRLIKKSSKWCPGFKNGVPSTYDFSVFIFFIGVKNS